MQNISLSIPEDIVLAVKSQPQNGMTLHDKLQLNLAIGMFVSQEISFAKAAQLAGKNLCEFMDILKGLGISAIVYTEEMLEDDLKFINAE
jgi:predicted HTH domain antitoxin